MTAVIPLLYDEGRHDDIPFQLKAPFAPMGDQVQAIKELTEGIDNNKRDQVLLGVTGSGKTFTMANIIQNTKRPALIMAPNKTLAAQLYSEMKEFFPNNAVEYFVSYYDYYQPEAYIAKSDTYIEKTASINDTIDQMRHRATQSLLQRRDTIVVASVSCIYGIGGVNTYSEMIIQIKKNQDISIKDLSLRLIELQYKRNDMSFVRGTFRIKGDTLDIFPSHSSDRGLRLSFFGDTIEALFEIDVLTGNKIATLEGTTIFANSHYVTPMPTLRQATEKMHIDLEHRLKEFEEGKKVVEHERLKSRTLFDIEMMLSTGSCSGIENYSRYLTGKNPGEPPPTLFEYLPKDALLLIDESHVTVPQVRGMFNGDRARKQVLVDFGFRLPAALDNRPLNFDEWNDLRPQTLFVSATPGPFELSLTFNQYSEQIIRPTGLLDPVCEVKPCDHQVDDVIDECKKTIAKGYRILITTLTKKMAESLSDYFMELGMKAAYMHSDIDTLQRIDIIRSLRLGEYDVLIGINLLREGLDIPECGLVAILDADKEGFLRSKTALIQTIGRAARNADSKVILYADTMTESLQYALDETNRRRDKQMAYNTQHHITPTTVTRSIEQRPILVAKEDKKSSATPITNIQKYKQDLLKAMKVAADNLEFEEAARLRDELRRIEGEG